MGKALARQAVLWYNWRLDGDVNMVTNVTRLLSAKRIAHEVRTYEADERDLSATHAAEALQWPPEQLFKTLVLSGPKVGIFVCCIPCAEEIDLRKAARAAGDKKCEMLAMKALPEAVGYVRGACSPIGMKKRFPTFIDETCALWDRIAVSAGVRGCMVILSPEALIEYVGATPIDLIGGIP